MLQPWAQSQANGADRGSRRQGGTETRWVQGAGETEGLQAAPLGCASHGFTPFLGDFMAIDRGWGATFLVWICLNWLETTTCFFGVMTERRGCETGDACTLEDLIHKNRNLNKSTCNIFYCNMIVNIWTEPRNWDAGMDKPGMLSWGILRSEANSCLW